MAVPGRLGAAHERRSRGPCFADLRAPALVPSAPPRVPLSINLGPRSSAFLRNRCFFPHTALTRDASPGSPPPHSSPTAANSSRWRRQAWCSRGAIQAIRNRSRQAESVPAPPRPALQRPEQRSRYTMPSSCSTKCLEGKQFTAAMLLDEDCSCYKSSSL